MLNEPGKKVQIAKWMTIKHKEANKHTHKKLYEQKQRFFENKTTKKKKNKR